MSNEPNVPATLVAPRDLESLVFGDRPATALPPVVDIPKEVRDRHAGIYTLPSGGRVTIAADSAGLTFASDEPALYAATNNLASAERFPEVVAKTRAIVDASAKGDFKPLFDAFDGDRPFEVIRGNQTRFWQQFRDEFGDYAGYDILGVGMEQGDPAVVVKARFARGGAILKYVWGPRRLAGFAIDRGGAAWALLPESAERYVHFEYRQPAGALRVTFKGDQATVNAGTTTLTATKAK